MEKDKLVGWCCMNCEENFYLEKNAESTQILGAINCPYCGDWKHTVLNEIRRS
ncbi:hypothetical protein NGI46_08110 [Peribacillus butanolivorans]|uniref:hypothetical protein n=1 Tax=Peribacillus butanolivorans TaxID=421767 RepID=UPI00207D28FB|nr:hypothetical protein [Peribacillus butanolivorans]MCO0597431.1 hypothetical protein [Peribacillus butanolivorans]